MGKFFVQEVKWNIFVIQRNYNRSVPHVLLTCTNILQIIVRLIYILKQVSSDVKKELLV